MAESVFSKEISDYSISQSSLEQLFITMARKSYADTESVQNTLPLHNYNENKEGANNTTHNNNNNIIIKTTNEIHDKENDYNNNFNGNSSTSSHSNLKHNHKNNYIEEA